MDPVTHTLSGALLMQATAPARGVQLPLRERIIAGSVAAAFPDIDVGLRLIDTLTYLNWHQGPTHSLVMLPVWALLLAQLFSWFSGRRYAWQLFFIPACLGILIHILGDLITAYGLMLLAPIGTWRFFLPLVFVIDPWFTAIIVIGLFLSAAYPEHKRYAISALAGLIGYVIFSWSLHEQAIQAGRDYAKHNKLDEHAVSALPQPLSPFNKTLIIQDNDRLHVAEINLRRETPLEFNGATDWLREMTAAYRPLTKANWREYSVFDFQSPEQAALSYEAWQQPVLAQFRRFAKFPVLESIDYTARRVCLWYFDLRFKLPGLPPSFRYGACRKDDGTPWYLQCQRGAFWID